MRLRCYLADLGKARGCSISIVVICICINWLIHWSSSSNGLRAQQSPNPMSECFRSWNRQNLAHVWAIWSIKEYIMQSFFFFYYAGFDKMANFSNLLSCIRKVLRKACTQPCFTVRPRWPVIFGAQHAHFTLKPSCQFHCEANMPVLLWGKEGNFTVRPPCQF